MSEAGVYIGTVNAALTEKYWEFQPLLEGDLLLGRSIHPLSNLTTAVASRNRQSLARGQVVVVSEEEIVAAMKLIMERMKVGRWGLGDFGCFGFGCILVGLCLVAESDSFPTGPRASPRTLVLGIC